MADSSGAQNDVRNGAQSSVEHDVPNGVQEKGGSLSLPSGTIAKLVCSSPAWILS